MSYVCVFIIVLKHLVCMFSVAICHHSVWTDFLCTMKYQMLCVHVKISEDLTKYMGRSNLMLQKDLAEQHVFTDFVTNIMDASWCVHITYVLSFVQHFFYRNITAISFNRKLLFLNWVTYSWKEWSWIKFKLLKKNYLHLVVLYMGIAQILTMLVQI